jgi:hypothetical protein
MDYTHIVGRVGTPPTNKTTPSGKKLTEFRLARDLAYDPAIRARPTEWYDMTVWEPHDRMALTLGVGEFIWAGGTVSTYAATSGDKLQMKVREFGAAEKFIPASREDKPKTEAAAKTFFKGVDLDEGKDEW